MGTVELRGVRKLFGSLEVIKGIDLQVAEEELVIFVGPSGCGKSTLLRMIAGLEDVDYGNILISGADVTEVAPAKRGVAMVFQNYALYPHMTAQMNMAYGLLRAGIKTDEVERRVRSTAEMLQISDLLDRKPSAMSGGQRQRVAIGRAIVRDPEVFLFDEPLSNLDASLRVETRSQIARLHQELRATMIFVTHDQVEAMTLADRIVVLNDGRIEQVGRPLDVYHFPKNTFVAEFIGSPKMNLLPGRISDRSLLRLDCGIEISVEPSLQNLAVGERVTLGVRPDRVNLVPVGHGLVSGQVILAEHLGDETLVHLSLNPSVTLITKSGGETNAKLGQEWGVSFDLDKASFFDATGNRIRE